MNCPLCSTATAETATECPSCGAIFAKLRKKKEKAKQETAEALAKIAAPLSPKAHNPWKWRGIAIAIVAAWVLGLSLYLRLWISSVPKRHEARVERPLPGSLLMRDPETGALKRVDVQRAVPPSKPEQPQEISPPEPPPPTDGPPHDPDFDD